LHHRHRGRRFSRLLHILLHVFRNWFGCRQGFWFCAHGLLSPVPRKRNM